MALEDSRSKPVAKFGEPSSGPQEWPLARSFGGYFELLRPRVRSRPDLSRRRHASIGSAANP